MVAIKLFLHASLLGVIIAAAIPLETINEARDVEAREAVNDLDKRYLYKYGKVVGEADTAATDKRYLCKYGKVVGEADTTT
ncbi:hypothetical protein VE00_08327 [Pseudogymnoascus sp. WSF 3629]|nr:hypothetical protein VE00_08327 [Pseudogymnoascus sp. WSF 3629]